MLRNHRLSILPCGIAALMFLLTSQGTSYLIRVRRPPGVQLAVVSPAPLVPDTWFDAELVLRNDRSRRLSDGVTLSLAAGNPELEVAFLPTSPGLDGTVKVRTLPRLARGETHRIPIRLRATTIGAHELRTEISTETGSSSRSLTVVVPGVVLQLAAGDPELVNGTQMVLPVAVQNRSSRAAPRSHIATSLGGGVAVGQDLGDLAPHETRTVLFYFQKPAAPSFSTSVEASSPASAGATLQVELGITGLRDRTTPPPPARTSCTWEFTHRDLLPTNGVFPPIPHPIAATHAGEQGIVDLTVTLDTNGIPVRVVGRGPGEQSILVRTCSRWITQRWRWPRGHRSPVRVPLLHFQQTALDQSK